MLGHVNAINALPMKIHDVLIVGAGLAGMRAALAAPPILDVAILYKSTPSAAILLPRKAASMRRLARMILGKRTP